MFYSKTTGGFYDTEINGVNIPADAVEITQDEHQDLLAGQSTGKLIRGNDSGRPELADYPPLTVEQEKEQSVFQAKIKLSDIDFKSIRPMREFLASQFPDYVWTVDGVEKSFVSLEDEAIVERDKL
jgi:hypothetical protein